MRDMSCHQVTRLLERGGADVNAAGKGECTAVGMTGVRSLTAGHAAPSRRHNTPVCGRAVGRLRHGAPAPIAWSQPECDELG